MSHAKRPWHAEKLPDGWYEIWADCDDGSRTMIAECVVAEHADLLAAAPDLLEAALLAQKTFIELFCEYECDCAGPGSGCESCPVNKALAVLDKAIGRAKGEEEGGPF